MNKIAIISPHFDDGIWSLGLQIRDWLSEGKVLSYINVFTQDDKEGYGPFQQRVLSVMGLNPSNYQATRVAEDYNAREILGITDYKDLSYAEALFRSSASFQSLNHLTQADLELVEKLTTELGEISADVLLFPAGVSRHRDHQILRHVGKDLHDAGRKVKFYLEFPYSRELGDYNYNCRKCRPSDRNFREKLFQAYPTQVKALGIGEGKRHLRFHEFWGDYDDKIEAFELRAAEGRWRDVMGTFRFSQPSYLMLPGHGKALDIGCGPAPHKELIENKGFEWVGMDLHPKRKDVIHGDVMDIPFEEELDMVLCWQVLEYVKGPRAALESIHRSLKVGGQLVLSVSALEPVHGQTYHSLSYHWLKETLEELGYEEVEIRPGTNGIYLVMWTYFKKVKLPFTKFWAFFACFPVLFSLSAVYTAGILGKILFRGGYLKNWVTRTFPLEFSGHLIARAYKGHAKDE